MEVILHLGAHRTASESFRHYLQANSKRLQRDGIGYWGPAPGKGGNQTRPAAVTRDQSPDQQLGAVRARLLSNLDLAEQRGIRQLVISDPGVIGTLADNWAGARLYRGAGERMARYCQAFGGRLTRVVLSIRSQDSYWSSTAACMVSEGCTVPDKTVADALASRRRGWRDVVTDLACALPDVEMQVQPYESFGSMPEKILAAMTGIRDLPRRQAREWRNRAPGLPDLRKILRHRGDDPETLPRGSGRWLPFDREQTMTLREAYADDLYWLRSGAGGLATFIDEPGLARAGQQLPGDPPTRGQSDGKDNRRLA